MDFMEWGTICIVNVWESACFLFWLESCYCIWNGTYSDPGNFTGRKIPKPWRKPFLPRRFTTLRGAKLYVLTGNLPKLWYSFPLFLLRRKKFSMLSIPPLDFAPCSCFDQHKQVHLENVLSRAASKVCCLGWWWQLCTNCSLWSNVVAGEVLLEGVVPIG